MGGQDRVEWSRERRSGGGVGGEKKQSGSALGGVWMCGAWQKGCRQAESEGITIECSRLEGMQAAV